MQTIEIKQNEILLYVDMTQQSRPNVTMILNFVLSLFFTSFTSQNIDMVYWVHKMSQFEK
jgi:hypothetical protein